MQHQEARVSEDRPVHASAAVDAALALLEPFAARILPAMLRRLAARRGYPDPRRPDLLADLRQELRLDCVQHPGSVLALDQDRRHQRWFRLAERWLYRERRRGELVGEEFEPAA